MKPSRTKMEALLKASDLLGRRPPKDMQSLRGKTEWRENHWRVWILDGWIDLDDSLELIKASEEFATLMPPTP